MNKRVSGVDPAFDWSQSMRRESIVEAVRRFDYNVERLARGAWTHPLVDEDVMPTDAVFVLTVVIFAFGGIAAAFAWAEAQNRGPDK